MTKGSSPSDNRETRAADQAARADQAQPVDLRKARRKFYVHIVVIFAAGLTMLHHISEGGRVINSGLVIVAVLMIGSLVHLIRKRPGR